MQKKIEITDAIIHRALVELGWLFPETEEEVAWAEAQMKREGFNPELPDSLKEPPLHLLEKIRRKRDDKRSRIKSKIKSVRSPASER